MIKLELTEIAGWKPAIRGMRNAMNSWEKSDSNGGCHKGTHELGWCEHYDPYFGCMKGKATDCVYHIGDNDHELMMKLRNSGSPDHRKYMRMIVVWLDITAPLYWWKEFKTYRAGRRFGDQEPDIIDPELLEMDVETNSCSTMHKIHAKEFEATDFSIEHIIDGATLKPTEVVAIDGIPHSAWNIMDNTIIALNVYRQLFLETKDKKYWWQMIQLLPSSYNQKRTVMLNYEVLANIYKARKNHKLDEWREFCKWIEGLPYSELITGKETE